MDIAIKIFLLIPSIGYGSVLVYNIYLMITGKDDPDFLKQLQ